MILLDGLSHSELMHQLENNRAAIPNLARLVDGGRDALARLDRELPEHHVAESFDDHDRRLVRTS